MSKRLAFFALASCACALGAMAAVTSKKPHRFQLLPRDLSLQPMPPENADLVSFPGAKSFTPAELLEPLAEPLREIAESGLTKPRADDAAYFLALFYRKHGFPDVEVRYEIRGRRLVLPVREGRRVYLRKVTFAGNRAIDRKTLYEYMIGGTEERLLKEPTAFPFVAGDLQTGVARIRGLYESEGFLDAVIDDATFTFSRDQTRADVLVRIREGRRYTVGAIVFAGNTLFPREELLKALGEPLTQPYTTQRANTMERNLQFFYKSHGYYQAEVTMESDPKQHVNGRVPIKFTVR
ncbi:MAG TPA: POTRA domain-containing protein, partial [Chthoniobacteraceae bacterium]|nr:POTRA domain-containing protein [Chthoniobacteraceae bacterium]